MPELQTDVAVDRILSGRPVPGDVPDRPLSADEQLAVEHTATATRYLADAKGARDATGHISRALNIAEQSARLADSFLADDTIAAPGRKRMAQEVAERAEADVDAALEAAEVAVAVARAEAVQSAKPPTPARSDALISRDDARMLLDAADERGTLDDTIRTLAARGDAVGGLVASDWLSDYLTSRGHPADIVQAHRVVADEGALQAALASGDPARVKAAQRALDLGFGGRGSAMRKAHVAALHATRAHLQRFKSSGR